MVLYIGKTSISRTRNTELHKRIPTCYMYIILCALSQCNFVLSSATWSGLSILKDLRLKGHPHLKEKFHIQVQNTKLRNVMKSLHSFDLKINKRIVLLGKVEIVMLWRTVIKIKVLGYQRPLRIFFFNYLTLIA